MKKRMLAIFVLLVLLAGAMLPAVRAAELDLPAPSYVLMERSTGEVLLEHNAHERLRPASVTKVMTLLLIMEALDDGRIGWDDMVQTSAALEDGRISWDDTVTTSAEAAAKGGSQIYLEENEQLPLEEMLKSIVVSSANDCACAMAEHIAGSEAAFVEMMNARAEQLGMTDTHFVNCTGLDDEPEAAEHLTTAYDIALMSRELLGHEAIKKYTTIWMDTVRDGQFGLSNTNKLVRFYDGTTGLKTGYTSAAGHCLSASAERNGMELIAVVLHCASSTDRFESAKALLNYGFSNYALVTPEPGELPAVPVTLGTSMEITPVLADETPILIDKALAAGVETNVRVDGSVTAPVEAGQTLGTLTITSGGQTIAERDLIAPEAVGALRWGDVYLQMLRALCMG